MERADGKVRAWGCGTRTVAKIAAWVLMVVRTIL